MPVDLLNPGRAIEIGVILVNSETEVLDIAPVDLLNGIGAEFIKTLPVPDEIKAKAPTFNIRWITETGDPAKLTANMTLSATV